MRLYYFIKEVEMSYKILKNTRKFDKYKLSINTKKIDTCITRHYILVAI